MKTTILPDPGSCPRQPGTALPADFRPGSGILLFPASSSTALVYTRPLLRKGGANNQGPSTIINLRGHASVHQPIAGSTLTISTVARRHLRSASLARSIMVTVTGQEGVSCL